MSISEKVIDAQDLLVYRGSTTLVGPISWNVEEGQQWVVFGPNGAGKTSLLELVCGNLFPSRGTLEVLGQRFGKTDLAELRTRIGVSSNSLARRIPGSERAIDVVLSAGYSSIGRWKEHYEQLDFERAHTLLEDFSVIHLKDREFGRLSEGERKRVLIARALMTDPELLLLDEPAAGLDLGGREDFIAMLEQLAHDPYAPGIIMVTHHVEEIPRGFSHAMILSEGRIVEQGDIQSVINSDVLSTAFGQSIMVQSMEGRFFAHRDYHRGKHSAYLS